jgi:tetratricopeptide (TPR) repeat protein
MAQEETVASIIGDEMDDMVLWQNALETVQNETATDEGNAFLWFNLGTIYNSLGQYEEAATAFDQARSIGLPWRMLWYQFGPYEAYYKTGRYEEVLLLTDVTLKDRPYFEESYYYKGLALAALGDKEAARENLEKAVEFNPNFTLAAEALATLH